MTPSTNSQLQKFAFWYFFLGWMLVLYLNKHIGAPACWFYSDARGEYSFSENLSALSYLVSAILLFRSYRKYGQGLLLAGSAFCGWLMLEEIDYGQIFLNQSQTNYYYDEDQVSLHTLIMRPVQISWKWDLADVAALGLLIAVTAVVPIIFKRFYKMKAPWYVFALPSALAVFAYVGKYKGFLVPWECGHDSFEEISETIQATTTIYFTFLLNLHLKENVPANPPPKISFIEGLKDRTKYIVSPLYDHVFFIWAPLYFLAIAAFVHFTGLEHSEVTFFGRGYATVKEAMYSFAYILTLAHLSAVFFRSHLNKDIFVQFPLRFIVVPAALLLGIYFANPFYYVMVMVIPLMDVYHSSLQTFGFGRLYDMRAGNIPTMGRRLDYILALFTYAGPILAGVSVTRYVSSLEHFRDLNLLTLANIPGWTYQHQPAIARWVVGSGVAFLIFYLARYWQYAKAGYQVSWQKVFTHLALAACSIYTWGFDTFGQSFFIMESYHAYQYFGLVWWSEKKNMQKVFHLENVSWGKDAALFIFLALTFGYGIFAIAVSRDIKVAVAILMTVEFLHYWYDGFIWSVRKKQVS